jgi:hypothetical protein
MSHPGHQSVTNSVMTFTLADRHPLDCSASNAAPGSYSALGNDRQEVLCEPFILAVHQPSDFGFQVRDEQPKILRKDLGLFNR